MRFVFTTIYTTLSSSLPLHPVPNPPADRTALTESSSEVHPTIDGNMMRGDGGDAAPAVALHDSCSLTGRALRAFTPKTQSAALVEADGARQRRAAFREYKAFQKELRP
ncbi:hypothetical protein BD626DRAFT_574184 [Schizophyllum amplum]|uniref:Uncharacterized protein n=2 Tax=Schizophyllum amplum TaxID=97359 RepID=A0A550BZ85_9AGAR|nr:hypothetical protein BD626DRAFT_574184 [Auriculariopsis ampla]